MMTAQEIRNMTFDKTVRGYRVEDVEEALIRIAEAFADLEKEKANIEEKIYVLAEKVDQYRNDEETLKTALLNAQRLGETVVYEAKQKAETIIYDATTKATQAREEASELVAVEELILTQMKKEVAQFKNEVLNLYKQHIEALSAIPGAEEARVAKAHARNKAVVQEVPEPQVQEPVQEAPEPQTAPTMQESPFVAQAAPAAPEPDAMFENYQGIRFED